MKRKIVQLSAKHKIILNWIISSVVIIIGTLALSFWEKREYLHHIQNDLKDITSLKAGQLVEWQNERIADAEMFAQSPFFRDAINTWMLHRGNDGLKNNILKRLNLINVNGNYSVISIVDTKGKSVLFVGDSLKLLDTVTTKFVNNAIKSKKALFTNFYQCPSHRAIHIDYIAPVISRADSVFAVIIFRVNAVEKLYPIIEQWPYPFKTAETLLLRKAADSVLVLNTAKNSYLYKVSLSETNNPFVGAVSSNSGFYDVNDFYNQRGFAYAASVPGTDWTLVTVVDKRELNNKLIYKIFIFILIALLLVWLLGFGLFSRYFNIKKAEYIKLLTNEKKLSRYYKEFHTILYSIGDGVITTDVFGNITMMNFVAEMLTGWSEADAFGRSLDDVFKIVRQDTRRTAENPVKNVLKNGIVVGLANHTILIHKSGREIPIADSAAPIFNDSNEIRGVVLVFRDKTEEHKAELKIRESEAQLRRAEIAAMTGNWEIHRKTGNVQASEGAFSIYGFKAGNLTLKDIQRVPLLQYRQKLNESLKNLIENSIPYNVEFKIRSVDTGEIKDIHSIAEYDKEHDVVFGVIRDITQQKRLEKRQLQLLNIIDNSLNEVYVFDANTLMFEYANRGALLNLGYTYTEIMALTPIDIKPNYTENSFRKLAEPLIEGREQKLVFETVHKRKNGTVYDVEVQLQFYEDNDKKVFFAIINDITSRKIVEQSLLQSQERWKSLFDNSPNAIAIYRAVDNGNDFVFTDFNPTAQNVEHINRDEVIGKRISEVFSAANELGFLNVFRKVWETGITEHHNPIIYKDNRIEGWRENIVYRLNTEEVVAIYSDVTDKMRAEIRLRESEERYRMLFNNMTQGFALHEIIQDEHGNPVNYRFIDVNSTFEELTGFKREELVGKTALERIPAIADYWIDFYGKVALTGESKRFERYSRIIKKYFDVWAFCPRIGQFAIILSDITARKKVEEQVQKLTKGIEQSPAVVLITDIRGNIEYVNPKFVEITGFTREEALGKNPRILQSGNHTPEFYKELWQTILTGNDWKGEIHNKRKNGELYWESALISPIKTDNGVIRFFIAIKEDITDRKNAEIAIQERDRKLKEQNEEYFAINEELTESYERIRAINNELILAREKAEENDRLKTAFLANMSHEIRTPMNGIIGFAELLKRSKITDDERVSYVKIIEQSGQRLLDIINNLIDISKIEANQITAAVTPVNISSELKSLYNFFKPEVTGKNLTFLLQGGHDLPELTILTDKPKFVSIVTNLLKNAIKFTNKGTIDFGFHVGSTYTEFYVSDTGMGISPKMQGRVFERFVQGDTSLTRQYEGAGLGLAITKSYVELLGGKISFVSREEAGTTFHFTLPNGIPSAGKPETEETDILQNIVLGAKKLSILIAEDDKYSMEYLKKLLEPIAGKMFNAGKGEDAVQLMRDNPGIDLIFMDMRMPDINGIAATRRIREFNTDVIIIAQTAFALAEDKLQAVEAGCNDYLTKPIMPNELFKTIKRWVKNE